MAEPPADLGPEPPLEEPAEASRSRREAAQHYVFVRHRHNWWQLLKFSIVGGSGFVVNLVIYTLMLQALDDRETPSAVVAFVVAATNNYFWNRLWTFSDSGNNPLREYRRFLLVGVMALVANIALLKFMIVVLDFDEHFDHGKVLAQAVAIILVTPVNFVGNKLWTFRFRHGR